MRVSSSIAVAKTLTASQVKCTAASVADTPANTQLGTKGLVLPRGMGEYTACMKLTVWAGVREMYRACYGCAAQP